MERSTLISVRLEKPILEAIETIAQGNSYLTRSSIINRFLAAMLFCSPAAERWHVLNCFDPYDEGVIVRISKPKV